MRRALIVVAGLVVVTSLLASGAVAGPAARVNHFVGNFAMLDDQGHRVGQVVADFKEPTDGRLVPGDLDIVWDPYDVNAPPFPFIDLGGAPVRESHAQLLSAHFDTYDDEVWGHVVSAGADGYLCDYAGPWNAGCRYVSVLFQTTTLGPAKAANWSEGDFADPDRIVFEAGPGAFALTYAGPTGG